MAAPRRIRHNPAYSCVFTLHFGHLFGFQEGALAVADLVLLLTQIHLLMCNLKRQSQNHEKQKFAVIVRYNNDLRGTQYVYYLIILYVHMLDTYCCIIRSNFDKNKYIQILCDVCVHACSIKVELASGNYIVQL